MVEKVSQLRIAVRKKQTIFLFFMLLGYIKQDMMYIYKASNTDVRVLAISAIEKLGDRIAIRA